MKTGGSPLIAHNDGFPQDSEILRLHLNENPFPPPEKARKAAHESLRDNFSTYPDSEAVELRERIAKHVGVTPDMVLVGNGVDELVLLIVMATARTDGRVVTTGCTFPGYITASHVCGVAVHEVVTGKNGIDTDLLVDSLAEQTADTLFVCNPHNPTGTLLSRSDVHRIAQAADSAGALPVFDEAYMDFVEGEDGSALTLIREGQRAVVLRTFSKAWGLASLRVGFAIGPSDVISTIRENRHSVPFSVNRVSQVAALHALDESSYLAEVRRLNIEARNELCSGLEALSVSYTPSATNFVFVDLGPHGAGVATRLVDEHRILVRDLSGFGFANCLRVSVGTPEECRRFCDALRQIIHGADEDRSGFWSM
ncbi:pyridoxal phosphate-dependent aminotransferase [Streptomyces sp. NPDC055607]